MTFNKKKLTTITVPVELKAKLELLKVHRRQPTYEVIANLIEGHERKRKSEPITDKQKVYIIDLAGRVAEGMDVSMDMLKMMAETDLGFKVEPDLSNLTKDQASRLIDWLNKHKV